MSLGYYDSCISKDDLRYLTLTWYEPATNKNKMTWGICVPKNCTETEMEHYYKQLVPFSSTAAVNARDPQKKENNHEFDIGSYGFFSWTILFTALTALFTYQNYTKTTKQTEMPISGSALQPMLGGASIKVGADSVLTNVGKTIPAEPSVLKTAPAGEKPTEKSPTLASMFDAIANAKSLIYPRIVNPSVQVFDFIRVMSMIWILIGHELAYRFTQTENAIDEGFLNYAKNSWMITYDQFAFFAVDLFLFMGGYVAIVSQNRYISGFAPIKPFKAILVYLFCVIKRYARIMPAYAYLLWYYFKVTPVLFEGPFA